MMKTMKGSKNDADTEEGSEEQIINLTPEFSSGDDDQAQSSRVRTPQSESCSEGVLSRREDF